LVDSNGLPVRLALSPGEMLLADRAYDADWIRELATKKGAWANIPKSNRSDPICFSPYLYRAPQRGRTGSSTKSNNAVASRRGTTGLLPTTSPSFTRVYPAMVAPL
jgi:transposase